MSNNLNNDNETTLLFKKFQGVAQTQVLTSDTGALSYTGEPKKSLTNVFQENIFSETVPIDLSYTLLEIYNGVSPLGSIPEVDFSNNVNNQTIVTRDLSAGVFGVDLPLTYYNKLYLAPTNGTNQAWWFIDPGSTTSTNNNILKNMIPYLYNDVNPNTYTPIVEYYNVTTSTWVSEAQASANGLNWSIDPASGILQFYQSNSILSPSPPSSPYQLNGITGGADISQNRPRISFIKYTGTFGSGTGGGGGGGSGLINVGKIDVSNNNVLSSHDVSGIYFDASGFDVSLNAGNTVTITNKGTSSGGIADLSYYFFNKPLAPTDGSGRLINTNLGGSTPYIRLNWTNPSNEQSALPYGTYTSYQIGATNESLVQNDRLPFFRHLHIEYLEYTANNPSGSPLLNSSWIDLSVNNANQTVIPNTIIEAELTYGGAATDLCGNSPDPNIAPYTKLTYGGLDNSKTYQFRIYLDNSGTNGPFTDPVYLQDVSWNYLYIPDGSGDSIELGNFGAPNPPNQIDLSNARYEGLGSSTELKFDASLSTVPPNYADASLNTPFPISASLSLAYAFGCTICGEILSASKQMPGNRLNNGNPFNYDISSGLQKNGQVTFSYDTEPVIGIPSLVSFDISACPEYKYTIHKPFGINNYDDPTFDPSFNLDLSTSIILPYPSRPEACVNSGARLPLSSGTLSSPIPVHSDVSNATAYPANSSISQQVWFITPSNPGFDVSLNGTSTFHIANNIGNDLRGISSEGIELGYLKADISNTLFDVSSASQFKGYILQTNGNPSSNPHIDWTASSKEAGKTTYPFQTQGYWTEIDISNIGIKDISLSSFHDICNNNYSPYTFKLQQIYNNNGIPDQPSGIKSYDFYIGQRPTESIVLSAAASLLSANVNNQFFGQGRPSNSSNISFNGLYSAKLLNLDPWWRKDLTIGTQQLRYDFPSPISIGSATTTPWPQGSPIDPSMTLTNPNVSIIPVTFMTTTEQYSRTKTEVGTQFNILITPQSNVLQSPTTDPSTVLLNFDSTGKNLWWDYTYNSNSNPSITLVTGFEDFTSMNYLAGPLSPANKSSLTATGNGTWPTDTNGTGSGFFNTYQHNDDISYNQLMWANGCFGSGGTYSSPGTDNPYIDYPSKFYNPGPVFLKDYSLLSTTYDSVVYDLSAGLYWNQVPAGSPPPAAVTISGEYKWIVLKYSNLINKGFKVFVYDKSNTTPLTRGSTSTTQTLGKYLMYICEENTGYTTAAGYPYNGRSGWLDAQVQQGSGSVTNQAVDGGGCWNNGVGYYKANQAGNPSIGGVASTLYLRIGIENVGQGEIASVVVEPVSGT